MDKFKLMDFFKIVRSLLAWPKGSRNLSEKDLKFARVLGGKVDHLLTRLKLDPNSVGITSWLHRNLQDIFG